MKLIQQLERKLSWRSSQRSTPGLAEAKAKQRKENGKKQRQQQQLMAAKTAAAVRVSDAEFSPYISFGCRLKTVPLNADNSPTSYEVVAIRTRAPFQTIVAQQSSLYSSPHHPHHPHHHHPRSPSPRSEGHRPESAGASVGGDHHHQQQQQQQSKTVEHIYDQIDCHHRRSSSLSPTTTTTHYQNHDHHQWSPSSEGKQNKPNFGNQSPTASSGSNESSGSGSSHCGPITVTGGSSRRRRNRIKTNPWFAGSPWAAPATKMGKENHQQQQQDKENIYESIENLLLNNRRKQQQLNINQSYTRPFAQPPPPQNSSATYLRRPARPTSLAVQKRKHLMETYPTSPMHQTVNSVLSSAEESPADLLLFTSPSVEFLNQSQQLCRQISSYFEDMSSRASPPPREEMNSSSTTTRPSLERKVDTLHQQTSLLLFNNSSDSMETIDLSPVNPFNHHHQPALSEWSLAAEDDDDDDGNDNGHHRNDHHQWDSTTTVPTISSPAPPPPSTKSPSPPTRSKRKLQSPTSRPESLYSNGNQNSRRQSAKVDRLKCQLKQVVHAAIQQAKTKKNRKEL